jgi:hypothetical protein
MKYDYGLGVITTLAILFSFLMVWAICHTAIANECKKQGSFYVGDDIYDCKLRARS